MFCLYAEDAAIFGRRGMFHVYLNRYDAVHIRRALIELFQVPDTEPDERDTRIWSRKKTWQFILRKRIDEDEFEYRLPKYRSSGGIDYDG